MIPRTLNKSQHDVVFINRYVPYAFVISCQPRPKIHNLMSEAGVEAN